LSPGRSRPAWGWSVPGAWGLLPPLHQNKVSVADLQLKPLWFSMVPNKSCHQVGDRQKIPPLNRQMKFIMRSPVLQGCQGRLHPLSQCQYWGRHPQ
jgi:hypothetical protein